MDATARKVLSPDIRAFEVVPDVVLPDHIPEKKGRPILALVKLNAEEVDIEAMITTIGINRPRTEQNMVLILVPDSVRAKIGRPLQEALFQFNGTDSQQTLTALRDLARTVLAMRRLQKNPQAYGLQPHKLQQDDVKQRSKERDKALETVVTQSYRHLWYPSATGQIVFKEIRTAGGEGGAAVLEQVRRTLLEDGELITAERINGEVLASLRKFFFNSGDTVKLETLRENFCRLRRWPMLESMQVLDQIVRGGVSRGVWCLFRMGGPETTRPEEFYSRESAEVPLHLDLKAAGYGLVAPEGAVIRDWTTKKGPDLGKAMDWVRTVVFEEPDGAIAVGELGEKVCSRFGQMPEKTCREALTKLVQEGRIHSYKGRVDQQTKPESLVSGTAAAFYQPDASDVVITAQKAAEKGWIKSRSDRVSLAGKPGAKAFLPMLRRIGSLYQRGGKTRIDSLDLVDLALPGGGMLRVSFSDAGPETLKNLGELFEVIDGLAQDRDRTEAYAEINDPQTDCPFMQELRKNMGPQEK